MAVGPLPREEILAPSQKTNSCSSSNRKFKAAFTDSVLGLHPQLHPVTHTYILILSYHTCVLLYLRFMSLSFSSYHIPLLLTFYHLIYKPHHLIHCHKTMKQEIIIRYFSLRINFI